MKTLSRIKDGVTGEEYYIGKIGNSTTVIVDCKGDAEITDWTKYYVRYTNKTEVAESKDIYLDANGECKFTVK
jgi:hypothetical protein